MITIYTDGSYNKEDIAIGWAFAVFDESNNELYKDCGTDAPKFIMDCRNIAGEMVAVIKAIYWAEENGYKEIKICHDYIGLSKWVKFEWKASKQATQWYREEVIKSGIDIEWIHTRGHTGVAGNEIVDRLAYKACYGKDKK